MMPSVAESSNMPENKVDYKQKYKALKKKLKFLTFEQECFMEELRKAQRKLLRISRDRSFLLDRLLQYEKVEESSGDSDATASSDSDDGNRDGPSATKKKKLGQFSQMTDLAGIYQKMKAAGQLSGNLSVSHNTESGKKKKTSAKKSGKTNLAKVIASSTGKAPGHMTREELERHLDSKKHYGIERAPALLPLEIFSNENSNIESDSLMEEGEDDTDLIIDVPQ